ncbi:MAG: DUF4268 domain-containing protein, partial [Myxococcales bacterium]|nr:DUF4268 domain-containing protein [Myxococcales bacterium]
MKAAETRVDRFLASSETAFAIPVYQRNYDWTRVQCQQLFNDILTVGADENLSGHFIGSIVYVHDDVYTVSGLRELTIIDGQQRLTTLSLLLIHLHHLQGDRRDRVDVKDLIFSEKYGDRSFNLDVPERKACMEKLYAGQPFDAEDASESMRNIAGRYHDIESYFPEEVAADALPYFVDWLLENVHLVEIETYSDEDAYTIFETMNDRGLSLSLPEMLKGYVLANIRKEDDQRAVNATWKKHMQAMRELGPEEDVDFFKSWLRGRHAQTIRQGKAGAENQDFERIGSQFHRWVRDQKDMLGLKASADFVRFVERDLDFYARQLYVIRAASNEVQPGLESVRYNAHRGFTLQTQALLAPLSPDDSAADIRTKIALVADYLDIMLARRIWNARTVAQSAMRYPIFSLCRETRDKSVAELSAHLRGLLDAETETFAKNPDFRLHQQNYRHVRHTLARLTHWVDQAAGLRSHFDDFASQGRGRPFEVEHIWENQYERFAASFPHAQAFEEARNRLGGLVLLQRGTNQSLGDKPYSEKRDTYAAQGQNLLTQSLHPMVYENNPGFRQLRERTGLHFRPYEVFDEQAQGERQELYLRIAEWVWNPSRLDLDGESPPVHEPIVDHGEPEDDKGDAGSTEGGARRYSERHETRLRFWTAMLEVAKQESDLFARISPTRYSFLGTRRHGQWWNMAVTRDATRVELYIDTPIAE